MVTQGRRNVLSREDAQRDGLVRQHAITARARARASAGYTHPVLDASTPRLVRDESQVTTSQGGQVPAPYEDTKEIAGLVRRAARARAAAGYTHPVLDVPASCQPGRDERHGVRTTLVASQRRRLSATTQDQTMSATTSPHGVSARPTGRGGGPTTEDQDNSTRRYTRDANCRCESCILRSSGAAITKWQHSDAKIQIRELLSGDKTHKYWKYQAAQAYDDNPVLFHLYKFENFSNNVRSLKKSILSEQESTHFDDKALEVESLAFKRGPVTSRGIPYYDTSETKKLLVRLATEGALEQYKHNPSRLRSSNPVFEEYPENIFGKCVNREKRRVKESVGWQHKRNTMKQKKKYGNM